MIDQDPHPDVELTVEHQVGSFDVLLYYKGHVLSDLNLARKLIQVALQKALSHRFSE